MSQTITVKIKLLPTKEQATILTEMSRDYISTVNLLVSEMVAEKQSTKKSSKDMCVSLPSAVKNQAINDAKVFFRRQRNGSLKRFPY